MNGRIDKEMLERFVSFFNENQDQKCTLVLNSGGGDTVISETITHMIEQMVDVTLIINSVYSAAFEIAFYATCKKILSKTSKGMWHYPRAEITFNTKKEPYYHEDVCVLSNLPIENKSAEKLAKKVMTDKEFNKFKKDHDIYFNFNRMKQIFSNATVLK